MGLGVVDDNLTALLDAMRSQHPYLAGNYLMQWSRVIGVCIALGVGANECYQMMLGRRGLDVMKLLHIVLISMCITWSTQLADAAAAPGMALEDIARESMEVQNEAVKDKEDEVAALQEQYIKKVREKLNQLTVKKESEDKGSNSSIPFLSDVVDSVEEGINDVTNTLKEYALVAETTLCEWISMIIRWIGQIIFQAMLYAIMVSQRIFSGILRSFAPLMFALSLSPHFKSAWSQWLSKYISISLWGFIAYTVVFYVFFIIQYNLDQDVKSYEALMGSVDTDITSDNFNFLALGMGSVGSTCMYVIGCLIGAKCLASVSEVASWCIPGGVASSSTGAMTGMVTAGAAATGAAAGSAAGSVAGGIGSAATAANNYSGFTDAARRYGNMNS